MANTALHRFLKRPPLIPYALPVFPYFFHKNTSRHGTVPVRPIDAVYPGFPGRELDGGLLNPLY
jgi:hypothetical protein